MDTRVAELIIEGAEVDGVDLRLRDDYSGRGMFGEKTHAIVCDRLNEFLVALATTAGELGLAGKDEDLEQITLACQDLRQDQMGLGIVLY